MRGSQFVHLEVYSMGGSVKRQKKVPKGTRNATVAYILGEAGRRPGESPHIRSPRPAEVAFGLDVDALQVRHNEMVEAARSTRRNKRIRIRKDQPTLGTAVASYPLTWEDSRFDAADHARWEARNISYFQEKFGSQLVSAIRHVDESHPHLHLYLLPSDSSMRAIVFHPGAVAKAAVMEQPPFDGQVKASRRAYREAMEEFQDEYHEAVGLPSGLTRVGPQVRRLTRAEWQAEQHVAVRTAHVLELHDRTSTLLDLTEGERLSELHQLQAVREARQAEEAGLARLRDERVREEGRLAAVCRGIAEALSLFKAWSVRRRADPAGAMRELPQIEDRVAELLPELAPAAPPLPPPGAHRTLAGLAGAFRRSS